MKDNVHNSSTELSKSRHTDHYNKEDEVKIWHLRMGHLHYQKLQLVTLVSLAKVCI